MSPFAMPSLITRLRGQRRRPARPLEPADMGTAFGMEQWLDEREHGVAPSPKRVRDPNARAWLPRWLHAPLLRRAGG